MTYSTADETAVLTDPIPPAPLPVIPISVAGQSAFDGLSVRDYFAAAALTGLLAQSSVRAVPNAEAVAKQSRELADALLIELHNNPFPG